MTLIAKNVLKINNVSFKLFYNLKFGFFFSKNIPYFLLTVISFFYSNIYFFFFYNNYLWFVLKKSKLNLFNSFFSIFINWQLSFQFLFKKRLRFLGQAYTVKKYLNNRTLEFAIGKTKNPIIIIIPEILNFAINLKGKKLLMYGNNLNKVSCFSALLRNFIKFNPFCRSGIRNRYEIIKKKIGKRTNKSK